MKTKTKESNPNWRGGKNKECLICGALFWVKPSHFEKRKCCSKACASTHYRESKMYSGENNPAWKGGEELAKERAKQKLSLIPKKPKVQRDVSGPNNPRWVQKDPKPCEYCGDLFIARPSYMKYRRFCSHKCKSKASETLSDEERVTLKQQRASPKYRKWRKEVLKRDKCCILCSSTDNLQADHIKSFKNHPELRFDVNNGRILCQQCHVKTPNYGNKERDKNITINIIININA